MNQENKSYTRKWYLPIFVIGLAIGYIGLNSGCSTDNTAADTDTSEQSTTSTIDKNDIAPQPGIIKEEKDLKSVTLPGGKEIAFAEGSSVEKIVAFLNADDMDMKTGFDVSGGERQNKNLAALMEVYSDFDIELKGNAEIISPMKSSLVALGIDSKRIDNKVEKESNSAKLYFTE